MKPANPRGHAAYQERVLDQLRNYYPDAASSLPSSTWEIIEKFWNLDLSEVDLIMKDRYSSFGPAPRLPSDMLRSILLSVEVRVSSYTRWAADLKENPLHAILSGFSVGGTPGVGTFYDFQRRLWLSDKKDLSDPLRPPCVKPKKPDRKGEKAPSVEKVSVADLFKKFETDSPTDMDPCRLIWQIFQELFLSRSVSDGLTGPENLSLAGDGTPIRTAARERKKRTCDCLEKGIRSCSCDRLYSQPDCNTGWDSMRECYYFGYDLYMLTASDSVSDLPVFPFLGPASRHDSIGFLYNWFSMKQFLPEVSVKKLLLDCAHDAMPYYQYCLDNGIVPYIDLNADRGKPTVYKDDFTINEEGVPVCRQELPMRRYGTEPERGRSKFRCPKISFASGKPFCTCEEPCSDAKYGRTVHLRLKDNPRLFNDPPRSSRQWKLEYSARTSAERCNKREKVDYRLEDGRYRSSRMWYCRLFCIMMCQHLDAWTLPETSPLKDVF